MAIRRTIKSKSRSKQRIRRYVLGGQLTLAVLVGGPVALAQAPAAIGPAAPPSIGAVPATAAVHLVSPQPAATQPANVSPVGFIAAGLPVGSNIPTTNTRRGDLMPALASNVARLQIQAPKPAEVPVPLPPPEHIDASEPGAPTGPRPAAPAPPVVGEPVPVREVPTATLDELERMSMSISPNIREAAARITAARGRALQVGLYPNPTASMASPQLAGSYSQYMGYFQQELVTMGKLQLNRAAAMREVQQAELNFTRVRYDLLTAVRGSFYSTLVGQQRVQVLTELVDIANTSLVTAERLKRGGEASDLDVLFFRIERDRAAMGLVNAQALLAAARRRLAASMGIPEMDVPRVVAQVDARLPDFQYVALRQGVVSVNALAQIAQVEVAKNRILLQRAVVEPWPNISAMGGFQYQVGIPPLSQGLFNVTMIVPLFNRNQGNIRAVRADIGAASQQVARVQNELSARVALALGNFQVAQQQVTYYERDILPRAAEILRISKQAYALGHFDFLRLLQSQRTLLESRVSYVNAQENRWLSAAELAGLLQIEQFP
ncbi:MAG: TolC family protein [Pirellulales bacterium]|nr:TolC family protein [Pirellulales bacterium]